ncbi:anomalous homeobox protein [Tachyglossus aculeatus]|uniref:anomalous homeobox protein n=1 Tax=Tachyglossus aculeatus TaxID=9261 RepID=UPI0018F30E17|nr:anomalous homeobox protein [Tachyglossus aculeatus]
MKKLLVLLKQAPSPHPPQDELVQLAGRFCRDFRDNPLELEPLVEALIKSEYLKYFLTNSDVVRACVLFYVHRRQHQAACRLLEGCKAVEDRKELVQLWNEIHYHRTMDKYNANFLTPVQRYRSRKRNPPPPSLCPEGVKTRNHPKEVRQKLLKFALEVTAHPNKEQQESLAVETNLHVHQITNWFANYRRRYPKTVPGQQDPPWHLAQIGNSTEDSRPQPVKESYLSEPTAAFQEGFHLKELETSVVPWETNWEESALELQHPADVPLMELLNSSFKQGNEFEQPSKVLGTPTTAEHTFYFEEPRTDYWPLPPSSIDETASRTPQLWLGHLMLDSNEQLPFKPEQLVYKELDFQEPFWDLPKEESSGGYQGPYQIPGPGYQEAMFKNPLGMTTEAGSEANCGLTSLEVGSFSLEEQLSTLESIFPQSSPQVTPTTLPVPTRWPDSW